MFTLTLLLINLPVVSLKPLREQTLMAQNLATRRLSQKINSVIAGSTAEAISLTA